MSSKIEKVKRLLTEIGLEAGKAARELDTCTFEDTRADIAIRRVQAEQEYRQLVVEINETLLMAHFEGYHGFDKKPNLTGLLGAMGEDDVEDIPPAS